ncbi:mannitol dehydrogenase family protein [Cohaesibacter celericrescens]|uniref:Mannitol dehydrogenase n=1 Tax=Cohaesibacter celericrescens TaxID=2067669 RepID=A0A2N5XQ59_9HYPH|nr:mannitol dehydrogenase family protein [Cohaesibacter celericrescens]PLW76558.1 mannitol dehydrogenase [Cohaesibacter celericrescens]
MSVALSSKTINTFGGLTSFPRYDRSKISPGILHIGVGNFHRAHMSVYMDSLFNMGLGQDWGIVGAGIQPGDEKMRSNLEKQDWLTTIVELDPSGLSARVTGAMVDFLPVDIEAILVGLTDPRIRIVSMTITEGGYFIDAATGGLDIEHPDIRKDASHPDEPQTLFGMIIRALRVRRERSIPPFTVVSCDNLPGNGHVARQTVVGLARLSDAEFADWIEAEVAFPNCMVDCITPATTARERSIVREQFGIEDTAPVVCEPFHQWVIEDTFPNGRPPLEEVGVEFVSDVTVYELMKLRILNAGHASTCYAAALLGYHFVHDALADEDIREWVRALQIRESIPTLGSIEGVDYSQYLAKVVERFSNPEIGDTIPRNIADGSDRQPKFILPTLRDALDQSGSIDGLALEIALWCRYCTGVMENGDKVIIQDPIADTLTAQAEEAKTHPKAFIEIGTVFGDLVDSQKFVSAFGNWYSKLLENGVRQTLKDYVAMGSSAELSS